MSNYEQKYTSMPHIEIVPGETLNEKKCYHLQELLIEVTLKYLSYVGISHPDVSCRKKQVSMLMRRWNFETNVE